MRALSSCLVKCEELTSQLKVRTDNPQNIMFDRMWGVGRGWSQQASKPDIEGSHSKLAMTEKRTWAKRPKRDIIQPPAEPDSKAGIDDDTMELISHAKKMRDVLSRPEYSDADD